MPCLPRSLPYGCLHLNKPSAEELQAYTLPEDAQERLRELQQREERCPGPDAGRPGGAADRPRRASAGKGDLGRRRPRVRPGRATDARRRLSDHHTLRVTANGVLIRPVFTLYPQ